MLFDSFPFRAVVAIQFGGGLVVSGVFDFQIGFTGLIFCSRGFFKCDLDPRDGRTMKFSLFGGILIGGEGGAWFFTGETLSTGGSFGGANRTATLRAATATPAWTWP